MPLKFLLMFMYIFGTLELLDVTFPPYHEVPGWVEVISSGLIIIGGAAIAGWTMTTLGLVRKRTEEKP